MLPFARKVEMLENFKENGTLYFNEAYEDARQSCKIMLKIGVKMELINDMPKLPAGRQ